MGQQALEFFLITHGSADYRAEVGLRHELLRKPLGMSFTAEELAAEADSHHLGCRFGDRLVGCLVLRPLGSARIQMRQVAVDQTLQRRGIGRALVEHAEDFARRSGFREMYLHARESALPFYEKLGYAPFGEGFIEVGIPHREMRKLMRG